MNNIAYISFAAVIRSMRLVFWFRQQQIHPDTAIVEINTGNYTWILHHLAINILMCMNVNFDLYVTNDINKTQILYKVRKI